MALDCCSRRHRTTRGGASEWAAAADDLGKSRCRPRTTAPRLPQLVHSTSRARAGWRVCVAGGAEEPRLARRVRSSKRRRHDAYAAPRRRRARESQATVPSPARAAVARPRERRAAGARPKRYDALAGIALAPVTRWLIHAWGERPAAYAPARRLRYAWSSSPGVDAVVTALVLAASRPSVSAPSHDRTDPCGARNVRAFGDEQGANAPRVDLTRSGSSRRRLW
jgi:hypothetical protein